MRKNFYPKKSSLHPKKTGALIAFEGIDGAGCETQSKLLFNYLKKKGKAAEYLAYPDYEKPVGKLIHQFLHKKFELSTESQFLFYLTDFLKDKEKIKNWRKSGKNIISDRYFTSTLAYQCQKGFPLRDALKIAKIFDLPKPDLVIHLKVSPQTSIKRKYKEKGRLDRHEADKKFLSKLTKSYQKLIRNQIFCRWITINGEKPIKEVFEQIKLLI